MIQLQTEGEMKITAVNGNWVCVEQRDRWVMINYVTRKRVDELKKKNPDYFVALCSKWGYQECKPVEIPALSAVDEKVWRKARASRKTKAVWY
jgi:hypothetical protein